MFIAILSAPIKIGHYKELFPNTSFGSNGPTDDFLKANNAKKVSVFKPHDSLTEGLVSADPYVDGEFVYTVKVAPLTVEQIEANKQSAMAQLKAQRNVLLSASDWTQLPDNPIANKAEWATYRQLLRDFPATVEDARLPYEFPHDPNYVAPVTQ